MKIEQALVLYLLKNKQMSLQGIGTFSIDIPLPEVTDNEKPVVIPANAVSFQYDPKVGEDESIIDFIVLHTKKIKPLASADLDSFLTLGRQFLNIGKPFTIHNIGTLDKLKSGVLEFRPGQLILQKMQAPRDLTENDVEENDTENLFNDYQKARGSNSGKRALAVIVLLLIVGFAAWAIWFFLFKKNDAQPLPADNIVPVSDSAGHSTDPVSNGTAPDTSKLASPGNTNTASFDVVVKETKIQQVALTRLAILKSYGRHVVMYTNDSVTYKVAEHFQLPLSDTTKILDSLNRYYPPGQTYIEIR
ncbi:MAG: hypothetical protein ABI594_14145 [Ginsengibacter sp.]